MLLHKTDAQSSILFLSRTVDRISQTCLVVKKLTPQPAVMEVIAIPDRFKLCFTVIARGDVCQGHPYLLYHLLFQTGTFEFWDVLQGGEQCEDGEV